MHIHVGTCINPGVTTGSWIGMQNKHTGTYFDPTSMQDLMLLNDHLTSLLSRCNCLILWRSVGTSLSWRANRAFFSWIRAESYQQIKDISTLYSKTQVCTTIITCVSCLTLSSWITDWWVTYRIYMYHTNRNTSLTYMYQNLCMAQMFTICHKMRTTN